MANNFSDRLCDAVKAKGTILTVGIDPVYGRLPEEIRSHKSMNDENDVAASVDAIFDFCTKVLRIISGHVPAVKMNIAYFEQYLWEGLETYFSLISEADALGLEVIGDVKRGDIGHTAEAYATAHLKNPDMVGIEDIITPDAITVNGFAGSEGILPFADIANKEGKGIFVWVRSSNPTAAELQDFSNSTGEKFYEKYASIVSELAMQNKRLGKNGYSNVGLVAGLSDVNAAVKLRQMNNKLWYLVPGLGAQGASAEDCVKLCNPDGNGALINSSRSIIYAYEKPVYRDKFGDNWQKCIEQSVIDTKEQLRQAMQ